MPIQVLEEAKDSVTSLVVQGHLVIAGSVDGFVRTYDIRQGELRTDFFDRSSSALLPLLQAHTIPRTQNQSPPSNSLPTRQCSSSQPWIRQFAPWISRTGRCSSRSRATRTRATAQKSALASARRPSLWAMRTGKSGAGRSKACVLALGSLSVVVTDSLFDAGQEDLGTARARSHDLVDGASPEGAANGDRLGRRDGQDLGDAGHEEGAEEVSLELEERSRRATRFPACSAVRYPPCIHTIRCRRVFGLLPRPCSRACFSWLLSAQ